jgi:hypothetical protein
VKTRARAHRWREEIVLLDKEMRRAVAFCWHMVREWQKRQNVRPDVDPVISEGIRAYAAHQMSVETNRATKWFASWGSIRYRAKEVLHKKLGAVEEDMGEVQDIVIPDDDDIDNLYFDDD